MNALGRVVALVPAYNEAARIGTVLEALAGSEWLSDVVVIDDGSSDGTGEVAMEHGARVITLEKNMGKGAALQRGIEVASEGGGGADVYVFIDADLIGLGPGHIEALLAPLVGDEQCSMVVGIATGGKLRVDLAQRLFPVLNGQRALRRSFVERLPDLSGVRWGVEVLLTTLAKKRGFRTADVRLEGLTQVMKEEKNGYLRGVWSRLVMYKQVLATWWSVRRSLRGES